MIPGANGSITLARDAQQCLTLLDCGYCAVPRRQLPRKHNDDSILNESAGYPY